MGSDNPAGADNQQERLIEQRGWVIGFVHGEGCFSIGSSANPAAVPKRLQNRMAGGTRVRGYARASSIACLHELVDFFGVGMVIVSRRHDNDKEPLHRYVVRSRVDLRETMIPFFRAHPVRTAKRANFEKFAYRVDLIDRGVHLDPEGLIRIAEVAETMNRRKPRSDLIRILRDHTPEVQDTGS